MSQRNDGFDKSRSVLGDVTNRLGKRGFSEREKSGVKHVRVSPRQCTDLDLTTGNENNNKGLNVQVLDSFAFSERSVDIEAELTCGHGNSNGKNALKLSEKKAESPRVHPVFAVDNGSLNTFGDVSSSVHDALTMRDKIGSQTCKDPSFTDLEMGRALNSVDSEAGGSLPLGKFDSLKGYKILEIPNAVTENTSPNLKVTVKSDVVDVASSMTKLSECNYINLLNFGRANAIQCANKDKNKLGYVASANTSSTVSDTGSDCLLDCINCDAGAAKVSLEGTQKSFINHLNEVEGHNADNCIMSQSDSIECVILPDSQESRIFGAEKSSESKKCKEYPYIGGGVDVIKTCSCSFCTKAAYIWLDLNYQDIRGRVSAIRKSQKEASILAERNRITKETEKHDAEGSTRISKLEIDLMHQWRFLFQHMAGIWEQEGDHLETSLSSLTDLREKCKRDLCSD
ncbi:uncharacterized protein [Henckelia pumila]|uniref:uncharacterized protein isoform X1 n=1 Tax=Henckelia pumila TaxID=405737 RepID=UPI003C6E27BD